MRCGSNQGYHTQCAGQDQLNCDSGYLISSSTRPNACVTLPDAGLTRCVLSDTPDPRCANKDYYCDGDVRVECEGPYVLSRDDCAARGLRCVDDGTYLQFCE